MMTLPRFTVPRYASAVYPIALCLSLRLSVCDTTRYCIQMAKRSIKQATPHDSAESL